MNGAAKLPDAPRDEDWKCITSFSGLGTALTIPKISSLFATGIISAAFTTVISR
jgi:hypothetical protein